MPQTIDYPNDYQDDMQQFDGEDGSYNQEDMMDGADDYLQKEREIKELNDLRIKTLERLVKEKVDIIH